MAIDKAILQHKQEGKLRALAWGQLELRVCLSNPSKPSNPWISLIPQILKYPNSTLPSQIVGSRLRSPPMHWIFELGAYFIPKRIAFFRPFRWYITHPIWWKFALAIDLHVSTCLMPSNFPPIFVISNVKNSSKFQIFWFESQNCVKLSTLRQLA